MQTRWDEEVQDGSAENTGISSKFASSTDTIVYVNPKESGNDDSKEDREKEDAKKAEDKLKWPLFKALLYTNICIVCKIYPTC